VPADAGFLRDEIAVHGTAIKETPCEWAHSTPMSMWPVCALLMHGETKEIFHYISWKSVINTPKHENRLNNTG